MEYFIAFILVFTLGFFVGWRLREVHARNVIEKYGDQHTKDILESFKKDIVDIKVELSDGLLFVYKKEDGAYLAHAKTMAELEDILQEKYPGKFFNATPEDLKKLQSE